MRHGNRNNSLSRTASHRKAMLSNMACSLIEHKRITTTLAKAKVLRKFVEPLITKSKTDSTHSRRLVFGSLKSKDAVTELFRDVAPKVATREGGYTRIVKLGSRLGDAAEMCLIELVDFNEIMLQESKTKTRRGRRSTKKQTIASATESISPKQSADTSTPVADDELENTEEAKRKLQAEEAAVEAKEKEVKGQELASEENAIEAKEKIPVKEPKSDANRSTDPKKNDGAD